MSVVSGIMGANAAENAAEIQSNAATEAARNILAQQEKTQERFEPFRQVGLKALGRLEGATEMPSYDEVVTKNLGNYAEDPETRALKAVGLKALGRAAGARGYSMPGVMASQEAELGQKYDLAGYSRFKQDLQNKYNALKDANMQNYARLKDLTDIGTSATAQVGTSGSNAVNQASAASQTAAQANAANQIAQAQNISNIGKNTLQGWSMYNNMNNRGGPSGGSSGGGSSGSWFGGGR